jgi:hypothetical protein
MNPKRWLARVGRARSSRWPAAVLALAVLLTLWWCSRGGRRHWPRTDILDAIRFVESSHRDDVPDGDGGRAIGPFQIHHVYWQDALRAEPQLGGGYQDCRRRDYAERVVGAYMRKWAADAWTAGDAEVIARVHNGGPRGHESPATLGYWQRVRARLP